MVVSDEGMKKYSASKKWIGFKDLVLFDKVKESEDITSLYFKSTDDSRLMKHKAGQFLPFKIKTQDPKYKDVLRTYSLSMKPNEYVYRISVKKVNNGLISVYLNDNIKIGDKIEAMAPMGLFSLKKGGKLPIVLIAGGIGITPLLSMLYEKYTSENEIYFVQATQNSSTHVFKNDITAIKNMSSLKSFTFYDKPLETDKIGEDYDYNGYISKDFIKDNLPLNAEFYFCGPPPFMKGINKSLLELGVSKDRINFEFFGKVESLE